MKASRSCSTSTSVGGEDQFRVRKNRAERCDDIAGTLTPPGLLYCASQSPAATVPLYLLDHAATLRHSSNIICSISRPISGEKVLTSAVVAPAGSGSTVLLPRLRCAVCGSSSPTGYGILFRKIFYCGSAIDENVECLLLRRYRSAVFGHSAVLQSLAVSSRGTPTFV